LGLTHISEGAEFSVIITTSVNSLFLLPCLKLEAAWERGAVLQLHSAYHKAALRLERDLSQ